MATHADTSLVVTGPAGPHPDARDVEMVERKGRGHPDSICDALAEAFSIALSRAYFERCGAILHHNVDKVLLAAGTSAPRLGGGEVVEPFDIFLAGRATQQVNGVPIPVADIAEHTCRAWLRGNLHALDAGRVRIHPLARAGSAALTTLVDRAHRPSVAANDTSFAVGYAPLSRLERLVLTVEQTLTAPSTIAACPMIGEDVKVMGVRRGHEIALTVASAIVDRHVTSVAAYAEATEAIRRLVEQAAGHTPDARVRVAVNTADDLAAGELYLTVTGTSAEGGDDGQTGRGNRVGGLITPYRPMTLEAAAGKNVVSHVGKTYSIVAHHIASELVATCPEVAEATCILVSRIGWPVDTPHTVEVQIQTRDGIDVAAIRGPVDAVVRRCLRGVTDLATALLTRGEIESPATWPGVALF